MKVDNLFTYPIKSTKGIESKNVIVNKIGFENDRYYAIVNSDNKIITARENPKLLKLQSEIVNDEKLKISFNNRFRIVYLNSNTKECKISIFKNITTGKVFENEINIWISENLKSESRLAKIDFKNLRNNNGVKISFNDCYPIHLITYESFKTLSKKLENQIEINRFRPNIIVSGFKAFEENKWKKIKIGECEFEVISNTERCSLITINPLSGKKELNQEPLRTLAKEFQTNSKVYFGIYLRPIKTGKIYTNDKVKVISNHI